MRLSRRSPREAISEATIAAMMIEASATGRTQIVADTRCTALRLVVTPSANSSWLLFCYHKDGRLNQSLLGRYPKIGVEEARKRAWELRLQVKGHARLRWNTPDITLERLIKLYENSCATSVHWGRHKDAVIHALASFAFRPWGKVDSEELQDYVDNYPSPGGMVTALKTVKTIVAWGHESGIIKMPTNTLDGVQGGGVGVEFLGGLCRRARQLKRTARRSRVPDGRAG
jgi:hypothetical protein